MEKKYHTVLSIAGSDPSGGAGIQADLKTFSACGCYGMTAITAIVDENTVGVYGVHPVPIDFVKGQIKSALDDIGAHAVKIGMLHSSELIRAVKDILLPYDIKNMVLDPVMVATSGDALLEEDAVETLKNELIPYSCVITPNIPEAEILLGEKISSQKDLPAFAEVLAQKWNVSVFLKAGHLTENELTDIFYNVETKEVLELKSPRIFTKNTHGTGCTLSSAIAANLALGHSLNQAAVKAKEYITGALKAGAAYKIGHGHGPVHHFFDWWE
ncbi:MAG: bifunctional hydroxymethylpyrimidine kinase/phosphomethylpyrimidine kinase [Odoribacter sp.]|nr:bifunctional hydroxymethylpyrimidine kinase/phosphomethylpyrimidine kinase [Odoribacter sp.]